MLRAMPRSTLRLLALTSWLTLLLPACGRGCGGARPPTPERTTPGSPAGEGSARGPSDPATPALAQTTVAGEGGGLALHGDPDGHLVALRLANTGTEPLELAAQVAIEREEAGRWAPVEDVGRVTVRPSCEVEAPPCTTLAPGVELFPPSWLGTVGDAQCACEPCTPVGPGRYRFVVSSCDGARRFTGDPFALE